MADRKIRVGIFIASSEQGTDFCIAMIIPVIEIIGTHKAIGANGVILTDGASLFKSSTVSYRVYKILQIDIVRSSRKSGILHISDFLISVKFLLSILRLINFCD